MPKFVFAIPRNNDQAIAYVGGTDFNGIPQVRNRLETLLHIIPATLPGEVMCVLVDTDAMRAGYSGQFKWPIPESWKSWQDIPAENVIDFRRNQNDWHPAYFRLFTICKAMENNTPVPEAASRPRRKVPMNPVFSEPCGLP